MIDPAPNAIEGKVETLRHYDVTHFSPSSVILCRNTAPLIAFAYSLLQRDVPCKILGRDIGKQLTDLVKKMRATNLSDFETKLESWYGREYAKALERDRDAGRISDQYECLKFFIASLDEDSRTIPSLLAKIDLMFTDESNGGRIVLSTIHKAKGLEWPRVFILDRQLMPSRYAKQPWQLQQERNLQYVAVTRAQVELFYITTGNWKETLDS